MKNKWIKLAGAVAAVLAVTASVQATPIVGDIGFTGTYVANGSLTPSDLTTVHSITISTVNINVTHGAFVGATSPTFASPIGINGFAPTLVASQLWSVLVGSTVYSLLVTTENQITTTPATIVLQGYGTMQDGNAADNTAGFWQLSFGVSGQSFTWQSTSNP